MVLCKNTDPKYRAGLVLYAIDLVLSVCALMIPNMWLYEIDQADHSHVQMRSSWFLDFPTCLRGANSSHFRCVYDSSYYRAQKMAGVWMMMVGVTGQLLGGVLFVIDNCRAKAFCISLLPEIVTGCSAILSYGGLLLYICYTNVAVNIGFGPGIFLLSVSHLLSVLGILLTSLHPTRPPSRQPCQ